MKEGSKHESEENEKLHPAITHNIKTAKFFDRHMRIKSPPITQKGRKEKQGINRLMEELSKNSSTNRKLYVTSQHVKHPLNSF